MKPVGYYIQRSSGLFPAPYPQGHSKLERICQLFHLLGIFLAKCLQDGRLVDIPLSSSFFKLMCVSHAIETDDVRQIEQSLEEGPTNEDDLRVDSNIDNQSRSDQELTDKETAFQEMLLESSSDKINTAAIAMDDVCASTAGDPEKGVAEIESCEPSQSSTAGYSSYELPWYRGILDTKDFESAYPQHVKFHSQLLKLTQERNKIYENPELSDTERQQAEKELLLQVEGSDTPVKLEDLW